MSDDAAIAEMLNRNPLVRFSLYSHTQVETVRGVSAEILELLEKSMGDGKIDVQGFPLIYGRFWLWVLGAYEITRTMSEYSMCFSNRLQKEIANFKKSISVLRVPFAKQQFQGREKKPILNGMRPANPY